MVEPIRVAIIAEDRASDAIDDVSTSLRRGLMRAAEDASESLADLDTVTDRYIRSTSDLQSESVRASRGVGTLTGSVDQLTQSIGRAGQADTNFNQLTQQTRQLSTVVNDTTTDVNQLDDALGDLSTTTSGQVNQGLSRSEQSAESFGQSLNQVSTELSRVAQSTGQVTQELGQIDQIADQASGDIRQLSGSINDLNEESRDISFDAITESVQDFTGQAVRLLGDASADIAGFFQIIQATGLDTFGDLAGSTELDIDRIETAFRELSSQIRSILSSLPASAQEAVTGALTQVGSLVQNVRSEITGLAGDIGESFVNVEPLVSISAQDVLRVFEQLGEDVRGTFEQIPDQLRPALNQLTQQAGQATGAVSSAGSAAAQTGQQARQAASGANQLGDSFGGLTGLAGEAVGAFRGLLGPVAAATGVLGTFTAAVRQVSSFDQAVSQITRFSDEFGRAEQTIREIAITVPAGLGALNELTAATNTALRAGASFAEAQRLVGLAGRAAQDGTTTAAQALRGFFVVSRQFGLTRADAEVTFDTLVRGAQLSSTSLGNLSDNLGGLAPRAVAVGLSLDQTISLLASLGTALGNPAAASEALESLLDDLGTGVDEFAARGLKLRDSFSQAGGLTDVIRELGTVASDTSGFTQLLSDQARNAVLALNAGNLQLLNRNLQEIGNSVGAAARQADVEGATIEGALLRLGEEANRTIQRFEGGRLADAVVVGLDLASDTIKSTSDTINSLQVDVGRAVASIGGIASGAVDAIEGADLPGAVSRIGTSVTGVLSAIATEISDTFDFSEVADGVVTQFNTIESEVSTPLRRIGGLVEDFLDEVTSQVSNTTIGREFISIVDGLSDELDGPLNAVQAQFSSVTSNLVPEGTEENVTGFFERIGSAASELASRLTNDVDFRSPLTAAVGLITNSAGAIADALETVDESVNNTNQTARRAGNGLEAYSDTVGGISTSAQRANQSLQAVEPAIRQVGEAAFTNRGALDDQNASLNDTGNITQTTVDGVRTFSNAVGESADESERLSIAAVRGADGVFRLNESTRLIAGNLTTAAAQTGDLATAFTTLGLRSRSALEQVRISAVEAFETILERGDLNAAQLEEIFRQRVAPAITDSLGVLPPRWAQFATDIEQRAELLRDRKSQTFDQTADNATASLRRIDQVDAQLSQDQIDRASRRARAIEGLQTREDLGLDPRRPGESRTFGSSVEELVEERQRLEGLIRELRSPGAVGVPVRFRRQQIAEFQAGIVQLNQQIQALEDEAVESVSAVDSVTQSFGQLGQTGGDVLDRLTTRANGMNSAFMIAGVELERTIREFEQAQRDGTFSVGGATSRPGTSRPGGGGVPVDLAGAAGAGRRIEPEFVIQPGLVDFGSVLIQDAIDQQAMLNRELIGVVRGDINPVRPPERLPQVPGDPRQPLISEALAFQEVINANTFGVRSGGQTVGSSQRDTSLSVGSVPGSLFPFQNGGEVTQSGAVQVERGELILPRLLADAVRQGIQTSGAANPLAFGGRGANDVTLGASSGAPQESFTNGDMVSQLVRLAAQGRVQDMLGAEGSAALARALVPLNRRAIRRRDITNEITSQTALTQTGQATIK